MNIRLTAREGPRALEQSFFQMTGREHLEQHSPIRHERFSTGQ